jgi:hypothetical protein
MLLVMHHIRVDDDIKNKSSTIVCRSSIYFNKLNKLRPLKVKKGIKCFFGAGKNVGERR